MPIKITSQKDYLLTEATLDKSGTDLVSVDHLMKISKGTGKLTVLYGQGGVIGISIEQRTRVAESVSEEVRNIVGVGTRELEDK